MDSLSLLADGVFPQSFKYYNCYMKRNREYPDRPIVGVGVVLFHKDRVLLIRRGKPPRQGEWSLPGGKQKLGETLKEAARREVLEETGLEMKNIKLIDVVDSINHDAENSILYHYSLVDWMAEYSSGELRPGGDADDARWFEMDRLSDLGLWGQTLEIIFRSVEERTE